MKYRGGVINKQLAKVSGMYDMIFRTRVIRQKVSLKIMVFSIETPCWSPSERLQHGGRKPVERSVARKIVKAAQNKREEQKQYGKQWEDLATLLFV